MFVSQMAFFSRIADPTIGGTYMTLLNTLANLGTVWVTPVVLLVIDWVTTPACYASRSSSVELPFSCAVPEAAIADLALGTTAGAASVTTPALALTACAARHGVCADKVDGYEFTVIVCVVMGWAWLYFMRPTVLRLERTKLVNWHVAKPAGRERAFARS